MKPKAVTRICTICKAEKHLIIHIIKKPKGIKSFICDECRPFRQRHYMLKRLYGIDLFTFNLLLEKQNNQCKACGRQFTYENRLDSPQVDHDHKSGEIRGLLCQSCNSTLGHCNDNIETLQKLIHYLEDNRFQPPLVDYSKDL